MFCPHCGHPESRILEARAKPDHDKRIRMCRNCGKTFNTLERVAVYGGRAIGYLEAGGPVLIEPDDEPDEEPAPAAKKPARYVASRDDERLEPLAPEARDLMVEWWNVSRFSKHGASATWTERAWVGAINRVGPLPFWKQVALVQAGIESGWQTLKPEYIKDEAPPANHGLAPKSGAMQRAIEAWNQRGA